MCSRTRLSLSVCFVTLAQEDETEENGRGYF